MTSTTCVAAISMPVQPIWWKYPDIRRAGSNSIFWSEANRETVIGVGPASADGLVKVLRAGYQLQVKHAESLNCPSSNLAAR